MEINRLMRSVTLKKLGLPGVVGVALLAFSLSLGLSTLLPSWLELERHRASAAATQEIQPEAAPQAMLPDELENQREAAPQQTLPDDSAAGLSLSMSMNLPSMPDPGQSSASSATAQGSQRKLPRTQPDNSPTAQLRAFYATFPLQADATESLSRVYAAAEEKNLQLVRGEYALAKDRQTGLMLYRLTLPVRGSYTQIREFVAAALKAVPTLALDDLSFERPKISDAQVQARIRLTLYLKSAS